VADDGGLDPAQVASFDDLARCLRQLHRRTDSLSTRELERRTKLATGELPGTYLSRVPLGRNAISEMLRGQKFPRKAFLLTFVEVCGVDLQTDQRWEQAWERLALADHDYAQKNAASEIEQLRRQVAELRRQLAESERLTKYKGELSTATWNRNHRVESGSCVEVANVGPVVALRSSANINRIVLLNHYEWEQFLRGVKDGEFDIAYDLDAE
jgi:hypothetical protein